jgi:hypothetical protein
MKMISMRGIARRMNSLQQQQQQQEQAGSGKQSAESNT